MTGNEKNVTYVEENHGFKSSSCKKSGPKNSVRTPRDISYWFEYELKSCDGCNSPSRIPEGTFVQVMVRFTVAIKTIQCYSFIFCTKVVIPLQIINTATHEGIKPKKVGL